MVLVNGPIQTKRPMKGIGLEHKNMGKELKLGPMGTFNQMSSLAKWWSSFLMIVGRLEVNV